MSALRVVLPIVLGIAAGILNFMVLRGNSTPLELTVAKADIKADTVLTEDMFESLPVRVEKERLKSAVPFADRGLLYGRRVTRPVSAGEVMLYADVQNIEDENIRMYLKPGESTLTLQFKPRRIAPGLQRGDSVGVRVPTRRAAGAQSTSTPSGPAGRRMIGPFRLLSLGSPVDPLRAAGLGEGRMVTLAVARGSDGRLDAQVAALDEAIAASNSPGNGDADELALEYYQAAITGR
jgi:hypothetical protein